MQILLFRMGRGEWSRLEQEIGDSLFDRNESHHHPVECKNQYALGIADILNRSSLSSVLHSILSDAEREEGYVSKGITGVSHLHFHHIT